MRVFLVFILALASFAGGVLFHVKYAVVDLEQQLASAQSEITKTHENVDLLKTEWTQLNTMERIRKMAGEHLDVLPLRQDQILSLDEENNGSSGQEGGFGEQEHPQYRNTDFCGPNEE